MGVDKNEMDKEKRTRFFKPKEGTNIIFVCPPTEGRKKPWKEVYVHYGVGINNRTIVCPNKMGNEPCPLCEKSGKLYAQNTKESKALAKKYWPSTIWFTHIIDLKEQELRVQVYRHAVTVKEELVSCFYDDEDTNKFIDYTKLDGGGFKVVLVRTDKSATENYIRYKAKLGKAYSFDNPTVVSEQQESLNEFGKFLVYEEIKEIMSSEYTPEDVDIKAEEEAIRKQKEIDIAEDNKADAKEEEIKDEQLPGIKGKEETLEKETKENGKEKEEPKPKCFGKEYSIDDNECLECPHEEACTKAMKNGK